MNRDRPESPVEPVEIPERVLLGTMTFGNQVDEQQAMTMIAHCLERGITAFDTANSYQNGEAERMLGRVLTALQAPDVTISTKVGHPNPELGNEAGLSSAAVGAAIDNSLSRLGVDQVDIYFMHMPDNETAIEETLDAFHGLVDDGKIRNIGISNYAAWQAVYMHCYSERVGLTQPTWAQQMYNLLARRMETEYVPAARVLGMRTMAYNPLAGGLLTGKYLSADPGGRRFERPEYRDRYWHEDNHAAVRRLVQIAAELGITVTHLALRWLISSQNADAIVLGASSLSQLTENLDAVEAGPLDDEVLLKCDEVWSDLKGVAPYYNR